MQPGKPQGFGTRRTAPRSSRCPATRSASYVSFEVFVRPAIRRMLGHAYPDRLHAPARLTGAAALARRAGGSSCAAAYDGGGTSPRSAGTART